MFIHEARGPPGRLPQLIFIHEPGGPSEGRRLDPFPREPPYLSPWRRGVSDVSVRCARVSTGESRMYTIDMDGFVFLEI